MLAGAGVLTRLSQQASKGDWRASPPFSQRRFGRSHRKAPWFRPRRRLAPSFGRPRPRAAVFAKAKARARPRFAGRQR